MSIGRKEYNQEGMMGTRERGEAGSKGNFRRILESIHRGPRDGWSDYF